MKRERNDLPRHACRKPWASSVAQLLHFIVHALCDTRSSMPPSSEPPAWHAHLRGGAHMHALLAQVAQCSTRVRGLCGAPCGDGCEGSQTGVSPCRERLDDSSIRPTHLPTTCLSISATARISVAPLRAHSHVGHWRRRVAVAHGRPLRARKTPTQRARSPCRGSR